MSELLDRFVNVEEFIGEKHKVTKSKNSILIAQSALRYFDRFLEGRLEEMVTEIKTLQRKYPMDPAPYTMLGKYVTYLHSKERLSTATINAYLNNVKQFLRHNGIMVSNENCKQFIKIPKDPAKDEHRLTLDEIKKLYMAANDKWKAIILVAISSGIRIGAILAITPAMITVRPECVRVEMPAEITKAHRRTEVAFMTLEAYDMMRQYQTRKDVPFFSRADTHINDKSSNAEREFGKIRKKAGLTERYPNSRNYLVHIHLFRSYFFTIAFNKVGHDMAQHLIGHKIYLEQYLRQDPDYIEREYVKLIPQLGLEVRD